MGVDGESSCVAVARLVLTGSRGFDVCRALAMREPKRCLAVHTCNPVFPAPTMRDKPSLWVKWQLARLTGARYPALRFGYVPSELAEPAQQRPSALAGRPLGPVMQQLLSLRPQTLAFSLCDSPIGLLAVLLDVIATQSSAPVLDARPRSPFLDPGELELQDHEYAAAGHERVRSDDTVKASQSKGTDHAVLADRRSWTPTDILNWTMMYVCFFFFSLEYGYLIRLIACFLDSSFWWHGYLIRPLVAWVLGFSSSRHADYS